MIGWIRRRLAARRKRKAVLSLRAELFMLGIDTRGWTDEQVVGGVMRINKACRDTGMTVDQAVAALRALGRSIELSSARPTPTHDELRAGDDD